jgi:hypothetical protein
MRPSDDLFYVRLLTLSDAEVLSYIDHYADYKIEAVQAAIAELRTRGLHISDDQLSAIDRYFTRHERERLLPFTLAPRQLRWLSYGIFTLGICSAIFLYVTTSPTPQNPLGYDPFDSKKYLRELEVYGGKINILAVQLRQWFESLWRGRNLAYTIAFFTIMLSSLLWFIGSHSSSALETRAEKPQAPSDAWS